MEIDVKVDYNKMVCSLLFDGELIKEFNLNKGDVGSMWGYFMYQPEEAPNQLKYHVILELANQANKPLNQPKLYIYPKYGDYVLGNGEPISVKVEGEYDAYLNNHKHYEDKQDE